MSNKYETIDLIYLELLNWISLDLGRLILKKDVTIYLIYLD